MLLAALLNALELLGRYVPRAWLYRTARALAPLAMPIVERRRLTVRANLQRLRPDWDPAHLDRATRRVFQETASYYVDAAVLARLTPRQLFDRHLQIDGLDHLQAALRAGGGVIVAGVHLANPEIAYRAVQTQGAEAIALVENLRDPRRMAAMQRLRRAAGAEFVPATVGGVLRAITTLQRGGIVALLVDRDLKDAGVCVPFTGRQARFPTGAVDLALRTRAAIVPAYTVRLRDDRFHLTFLAPEPLLRSANRQNDVRAGVAGLARRFEPIIREHGDQWRVFQSPWKSCHDAPFHGDGDPHGHHA